MPRPHLVVAVAYDQLCTFELGCVVGLFATPPAPLERPWYRFAICAERRGPLRAAGGFRLTVPHSLRLLDQADTIVVPGWRDLRQPPPAALVRRLRAAHARGARLCSVCSGVFVLAATGLLDGLTVTSHWGDADILRETYPRVRVNAQELYIDHGRILTSAGSAAGLDMLLHLVRRDHGSRVANAVAQRLVIPRQREGGQAQFIPRLVPRHSGSPLAPLLEWMRSNLRLRQDLPALARRARMSLRTLQRQFVEATGVYPTQWLTRERVAFAKELLEESDMPFWKVAEESGLGTEESFRRHFRLIAGTSPGRYRQQFGKGKPRR
jgi:AraC family transcriptional activator FtrA